VRGTDSISNLYVRVKPTATIALAQSGLTQLIFRDERVRIVRPQWAFPESAANR